MIGVNKLTIRQGDFSLVDINFVVPNGEYAILMGPTGSGKTSLLEAICGLRPIASGSILIDERDVTNWPPAARQIGYVPQDTSLFPSMRVDRQIEFAMAVRKVDQRTRRKRTHELLDMLEIRPLQRRFPDRLSGGEQKRVALARALSFGPRLLCLDEPLTALDASTRSRLSELLLRIHRQEHLTVLHVTHHTAEAQQLGTLQFQIQNATVT